MLGAWLTLVGVTFAALLPIAMPLLSGPGSIAVTISMATEVSNVLDYVPVGIGIVLVSIASWLVLRSSSQIIEFLGSTGVNVLTRLMGLILVCIGIQFVVTGILQLLADEAVVNAISQAYPD
jgi:multiple antibiotic resistance protein